MTPRRAILLGGLVVGMFDIAYAMIFWAIRAGVSPIRVLQSVAAGVLGREAAIRGGIPTAILGGFLHFFIATSIVIVYWLASRAWLALVAHPLIYGSIYGIGVWIVMNYVVIPLSATTRGRFNATWDICSIIVHMFLIGVPAALFSKRAIEVSNEHGRTRDAQVLSAGGGAA